MQNLVRVPIAALSALTLTLACVVQVDEPVDVGESVSSKIQEMTPQPAEKLALGVLNLPNSGLMFLKDQNTWDAAAVLAERIGTGHKIATLLDTATRQIPFAEEIPTGRTVASCADPQLMNG